ncbi:uncharacterized protein [Blastocystis hominis]|uniref:EF-hand domain-containing protein n=1 Tax=Blastocystis hominis TaxID=12968 RepID=D8LXW0_BLAHO|nr:uncharacterized protein [Blastocystis hominis]CBK20415.2 unnamed protein product [Blastocystis hominis]|eukprot:XP_012894463.1 uncharacterized protein [Blastocystis hominis]
MGNKQAKMDIKQKELKELREMTKFSDDEIYILYNSFKSASSSRIDDGVIDEQLVELVGMKEGFFFERLFSMFDKNNDGQIVFTEFLRCISFMTSRMPPDERLHYLFRFYDLKQDNVISRDELKRITEAMFFQYRQNIREDILNDIVENIFSSLGLGKDQAIDFDTFSRIPEINTPLIELPSIL